MRSSEPGLGKQTRRGLPPKFKDSCEAARQQGREGLREHLPTQRRSLAVGKVGGAGKIDPKADGNTIATAFEEYSGELRAEEKQVIGPLQHQRLKRGSKIDCFGECKPRCKRQGLRGRVAVFELNQRAAVEIARRGQPRAALPAPARDLLERYQPVAFDKARIGDEVGIGRAGLLDDADACQNSDPAARSVSDPSGPISR
jgi:hypothetical protein